MWGAWMGLETNAGGVTKKGKANPIEYSHGLPASTKQTQEHPANQRYVVPQACSTPGVCGILCSIPFLPSTYCAWLYL